MQKCAICEKELTREEVVFCFTCEEFYEYERRLNRKREGFELLKENYEMEDDDK